ncbi:hypothetical protein TNCV_1513991 [Trichonephila clavipes]|nr:hypothetical protein TNCV_1513991 [Trichonephila clavipes]
MVTKRAMTPSPLKILRGLVLNIVPATFDTRWNPSPPRTGCNSKLKTPISAIPEAQRGQGERSEDGLKTSLRTNSQAKLGTLII